jgi:Uncharacterized protein conserved in bacteria (DUF2188)
MLLMVGRRTAEGVLAVSNNLFIERRSQGDYAVRKADAERASAVRPTQADAIARARELNPDAAIHVERVRTTSKGGPDQWRKP